MPAPLPDLTRDQQCHYFTAPTGQRCGSPAVKGDYYCFQHNLKRARQRRALIDPELTRMELPVVEDRASIFVALAAVVHRLAENTIDTRRAGQMIYGLHVCLQSLPSAPARATKPVPPTRLEAQETQPEATSASAPDLHPDLQFVPYPDPEPESELEPGPIASGLAITGDAPTYRPAAQPAPPVSHPAARPADEAATATQQSASPPVTIPITKEGLLYFLRSRHCAGCNAELFPADQLTYRRNPGARPEVIAEAQPALPAPTQPAPDATCQPTRNRSCQP